MAEINAPDVPSELPVLPLRRTVAFPLTLQPLDVSRPVSVATGVACTEAGGDVLFIEATLLPGRKH